MYGVSISCYVMLVIVIVEEVNDSMLIGRTNLYRNETACLL